MKMLQQETTFSPIAFVAETAEEAEALWELARFSASGGGEPLSSNAQILARKIGNWFSGHAKL